MSILTYQDVKDQSNQVYNQFGEAKWKPFAGINSLLPRDPGNSYENVGVGKFLVSAAMGESLEDNIDTIRKYRDRIDILTCDKGFGYLIENGIKADYVIICDCNIQMKWIEKYIDYTEGVKLLSTPYANPQWTISWKGPKYFYVNKDAIQSEDKFLPFFGDDTRVIPAGSNVSNAMIVFMTGCDERTRANYAGYEKYFLVGYDYSWKPDGKYYAGHNPMPKRNYMHHVTMLGLNSDVMFTSQNLLFSAKWLTMYVRTFGLPVVNCSGRGILDIPLKANLEDELSQINFMNAGKEKAIEKFNNFKNKLQEVDVAKAEFLKAKEGLYHGSRR